MILSALLTLPADLPSPTRPIFGQPSYFLFELGRSFLSLVPICTPGGTLDFVHLLSTDWASHPPGSLGLRVPPGVPWAVSFIHNCICVWTFYAAHYMHWSVSSPAETEIADEEVHGMGGRENVDYGWLKEWKQDRSQCSRRQRREGHAE